MLDFIAIKTGEITVIITVIAGLFAFVKWFDLRNQKLKNDRYEKYIQLISVLSGSKNSNEQIICVTEQIASAWLLLEYKEYYKITLKILDNSDLEGMAKGPWQMYVLPQIKLVVNDIRSCVK